MFKKCLIITLAFFVLTFSRYAAAENQMGKLAPNHLFQVSVINALAQGVYDGNYSYKSLMAMSTPQTIGVGTFQHLDGEMVAVDGNYYQITGNEHLTKVKPDQITPFAEIVNPKYSSTKRIEKISDYDALGKLIQNQLPNLNIPYAIRIDGEFNLVKIRSVNAQKKPYPTLLQVSKTQTMTELHDVKGSVVGFWFPAYWSGIAVPGFHLHFVTADKKMGGHVLAINVKSAELRLAPIHHVSFYLPDNEDFAKANLSDQNLQKSIQSAEGDKK